MRFRRFALLTVLIGLFHGGLIIVSELIVFARGVGLNHPEIEPSRPQSASWGLVNVLMQPGDMVWTRIHFTPKSSLVEWSMMIANSLVWGAVGALIATLCTQRKSSLEVMSN